MFHLLAFILAFFSLAATPARAQSCIEVPPVLDFCAKEMPWMLPQQTSRPAPNQLLLSVGSQRLLIMAENLLPELAADKDAVVRVANGIQAKMLGIKPEAVSSAATPPQVYPAGVRTRIDQSWQGMTSAGELATRSSIFLHDTRLTWILTVDVVRPMEPGLLDKLHRIGLEGIVWKDG